MKVAEQIGDSKYGPLIIRVTIGLYFFMAGYAKLDKIPPFIRQVQSFEVLPPQYAALYAHLLPYFEVVVGLMLIIGLWTTLSSWIASLMLVSFIVAFGVFPGDFMFFNKDIILLASTLALLYTGPGAWSLDTMKK